MKLRSGFESVSEDKEETSLKNNTNETSFWETFLKQCYRILQRLFKTTVIFLLLFYLIVPVFVKTNPWIQSKIIFLNNLRWPPFIDFTQPELLGLGDTRNFYLQVDSDIRLGVWHVLPHTLHNKTKLDVEEESLLKDGRPIILYLHGNSGTRAGFHRVGLYKVLSKMDYHVIAVDYRGYGDSSGSPSEEGVVTDALHTYKWVKENCGASPVFLWGHSLGTGVTTKLARNLCKEGDEPIGVFLESGFNNILDAATHHPMAAPFKFIPWFRWLFIDTIKENDIHFESDQSIAFVSPPLLILHAEDDAIVPYELGQKLYQAAVTTRPESFGPAEFISFNSSLQYGHKLIFMAPELPDIIRKFVTRCLELKKSD